MPCKILVKFFVSTLRFFAWGKGCFVKVDGCYLLLFILVQLAQSDLKTFLGECLHDVFNNFRKVESFLKCRYGKVKCWIHSFKIFTFSCLCFWYDGRKCNMIFEFSLMIYGIYVYKRSWKVVVNFGVRKSFPLFLGCNYPICLHKK